MAKLTPAEEKLLSVCKETIDSIIREWTDNVEADPEMVIDEKTRYRIKDRIMVDHAIGQMWAIFLNREDNVFEEVEDTDAVEQAAYHHAVEAYFRIYRGVEAAKPGRRKHSMRYLWKLRKWQREGKTIGDICLALNLNPDSRTDHDRVRRQLERAEERCSGINPFELFPRKIPSSDNSAK